MTTARGGAPTGNLNAARNGTRPTIRRLTVGELPQRLLGVKREGRAYRRGLEQAVEQAHGDISVVHAHAIDTAAAATIHAGICRWLLREKIGTMTPGDVLNTSREIVKAKQARDAAVKALNLEGNGRDVLDALYRVADEPPDTSPTPPTSPRHAADGQGAAASAPTAANAGDGKSRVDTTKDETDD